MSKRILWLDNDPAYLIPFVDALKDENYSVTVVGSLTEAENSLEQERFDLMIIDVMIPTMNSSEEVRYRPAETDRGYKTGLVFYKQNREVLQKAGTRIMIMTVRLDKAIRDEFIRAGLPPNAFLTKYEMEESASSNSPTFVDKVRRTFEDQN